MIICFREFLISLCALETAGESASFSLFARDLYGIIKFAAGDFHLALTKVQNAATRTVDSSRIQASIGAEPNADGSFTVSYLATAAGLYSIKGTLTQAGGLAATFYDSRSFRMMPTFDMITGKLLPPVSPIICAFVNFDRAVVPSTDKCVGPGIINIQQYMRTSLFSAKFAGFVQPLFSETYTLSLTSPGSAAVFIDGLKIVNKTSNANGTRLQFDGTIALQAMTMYPILVEYIWDGGYNDSIAFKWKSSSQVLETIPSSRL